jgi:hypothetical protein
MSCCALIALTLGFLVLNSVPTNAQSARPVSSPEVKQTQVTNQATADDAVRLKEARLAFAIQVVSSLADEARGYKNEALRITVQARAADILWEVDEQRARTLFDRAWDAAQTIDKDERRRNNEARRRFLSGQGGTGFIPPPSNLRLEVLRLASIHDRSLAERFLAKMEEENKREDEEKNVSKSWDPTEPPEAISKRLQLARQLLETGDLEKALALAQPGLNHVTSQGIIFLVLLRQKDSARADQLFAFILERAASDPTADATSVSLLSSYVFSPSVLVTSTRNGLLMHPWTTTLPPPQLSPALRATFFGVASQILLRPLSPAELELTSAGLTGTYFTIQRLLPLFQQNVPEMAVVLKSKLNALGQGRDEIIPAQQREFINAGFSTKETKEETPDDVLMRIERSSGANERNYLYAIVAQKAALKNDPKARDYADRIEDAELKKSVHNFVDFILISKALEKKEPEKALHLLRTGELTHFQRAWSYTEVASLLKSSPDRATELISEAASEASRIDASSPESVKASIAIATRVREIDRARQWETALDVVKAANKTEFFAGEETSISVEFHNRDNIAQFSIAASSTSIAGLFAALGKEDVNQAADIAMTIRSEFPHAIALLASARSVLDAIPRKRKN